MADSIHCAVSTSLESLSFVSLPLASLGSAALGWVMFILSVFLILLVLVQRGKGGGLAGALGGPGGQSAFGSKAGDTFTVITAVSAIIWGLVCAIAMYTLGVPPIAVADDELDLDTTPSLVSPDAENTAGGLSGMGLEGLDSEMFGDASASSEESTGETPSAELTPAEPAEEPATEPAAESTEEPAAEPTDSAEPAEEPAAESTEEPTGDASEAAAAAE
ncbi:preprotein translocase subunit SecG [Rhodopirellula sp. MGV]|uniref:preprotein translocase subunit SecG n=1 Tax=Rhodopirellula sp. MGV TaxID=2023130 RepID=UPI000B9684B4|nr:preprotein translocase subunit SecG [Rhodopirellula sp. MGV]OYP38270.1 preprotein translocase subunit SecG [Rhodopirellula sp. MGV]PNY38608.1 preprotein translocase subunit SecG [Rhodopirellula baltica]